MEFEIPLPLTLLLVFVSVLFYIYMLLPVPARKRSSNIPGPKKFPIIGNLHLLAFDSRPHQVFRDLAVKYGPLVQLQLGEVPFVIASSVEVVKQVLQTHDIAFANRPPGIAAQRLSYNYTDIALAPYGEPWRHLRKICTLELFSLRRVRSFRSLREEENLNLVRWIASKSGSPTNLTEILRLSSFDIITRASVGSTPNERGALLSAMQPLLKILSGLCIADLYPSIRLLPLITGLKYKIEWIFQQFDPVLERIINQHRATNNDNDAKETSSEYLVDVLLKHQQVAAEMPLTTNNIKAMLTDMFTAGGETSATVVEWAMSEMMRNPTTLKRAQEEVREVFEKDS